MTDYASQLFNAQSTKPTTNYAGQLFGSGEDNINVKSDPQKGAGYLDVAGASFASDPKEEMRWYASRMFPGEPVDKSVKRFGIKDGEMYFVPDPKKPNEAFKVIPDQSWGKRMMTGVGPSIPAVTGTAAGIATAPLMTTGIGTAGTIAAAGGAAAAGDIARQKIGDVMYGPDVSTKDLNLVTPVREAIMAGTGEGIGKGMQVFSERALARDFNRMDPAQTAQNYTKAKNQGVDITPAEATDLPSLKADQKRLGNVVATSNDVADFYANRNEQVTSAFGRFVDMISKNGDAQDVARMAREAADAAIREAKKARQDVAGPLYREAFSANKSIGSAKIDRILETPAGKDALSYARERMQNRMSLMGVPDAELTDQMRLAAELGKMDKIPLGVANGLKLETLDLVKQGFDDAIRATQKRVETGTARAGEVRDLRDLKNAFVNELDDLDVTRQAGPNSFKPEGGAYAQARAKYQEGSTPVDDLVNGTVKVIADLKDEKLQRYVINLLNPQTRSPAAIRQARAAIEKQNPEAWQGLKRIYMQAEADRALRLTEQGEVANPAGKLYKAFMNPGVRENLKAAMAPKEYMAFSELMDVFKIASRVKPLGSDTAWNQLLVKEAEQNARPLWAKFVRNLNPSQALQSFDEFLTGRAVEKNAKEVVAAITSGDQESIKTLKALRKLSPNDLRWRALFGHLLVRGAEAATP